MEGPQKKICQMLNVFQNKCLPRILQIYRPDKILNMELYKRTLYTAHLCQSQTASGGDGSDVSTDRYPHHFRILLLPCSNPSVMLSKSEAHSPSRSPLSSPGFGSSGPTASPSALPPVATSGVGKHGGLGRTEECVQQCGALSHADILLCGRFEAM